MDKKSFVSLFLFFCITAVAYGDETFDAVYSDIVKDNITNINLLDKYKGKFLSGNAYVVEVSLEEERLSPSPYSPSIPFAIVYLLPDFNPPGFWLAIKINKESIYWNIANNLKKTQKIGFCGRIEDVFNEKTGKRVVYLTTDARLYP
ncbi:MAG: hypothetical protein PHP17_01005 [Candidatus Omnitrophica bacterium]|nr:hypothetical protein [Candidatus Omnitrophota bacterium]